MRDSVAIPTGRDDAHSRRITTELLRFARLVLAVTASALVAGCGGGTSREAGDSAAGTTIREVTPEEAAALVRSRASEPGFVILDIRTPAEFEAERIEGAIHRDYYAADFRQKLAALPREKGYLLYCRTGNRTGRSLPVLKELGFQEVYHLDRGIAGWKAAGLPVVSGAEGS